MSSASYSRVIVQLTYLVIGISCITVVALTAYKGEIAQRDIATAILALLGTFLGATLAFRLNEDKEATKLKAARRAALNRAMFVLGRQHNAIRQLKKEFDRFESHIEKAFKLPAIKPPSYTDLVHNFGDLEFMLESSDPNLLFLLTVEQERFHQALESLNIRNTFYVDEIQHAMAEKSLNNKPLSIDQLASSLGERLFNGAVNGANVAFEHIAASNETIPQLHAKLFKFAKEMFPEHKFVRFEQVG